MLDDSKIRSLILSISVTLSMATRHVYISRGRCLRFSKPEQPSYFIIGILAATREYHGTRKYHVVPESRRLLDHSGSGKVQPSPLPSEPFGVSARRLLQPKFGQQNEDGASMRSHTPDVIMTLVSYLCGLPGLARKVRKHITKTSARVRYQSHSLPKQCDATLC